MKKLVVIAIATAFAAGCSARTSRPSENTAAANPAPAAEAPKADQQASGTVNEIGKTTSNPGSATIQTQRQVVKTETVKQNIPTITQSSSKADVNRMTEADFQALGLPADQAANMVKFRNDSGGFKSVDDLAKAPGLDQNWFNSNKEKLGVSSG